MNSDLHGTLVCLRFPKMNTKNLLQNGHEGSELNASTWEYVGAIGSCWVDHPVLPHDPALLPEIHFFIGIYIFIPSFIQSVLIEHLLCARHCTSVNCTTSVLSTHNVPGQ